MFSSFRKGGKFSQQYSHVSFCLFHFFDFNGLILSVFNFCRFSQHYSHVLFCLFFITDQIWFLFSYSVFFFNRPDWFSVYRFCLFPYPTKLNFSLPFLSFFITDQIGFLFSDSVFFLNQLDLFSGFGFIITS